ncbi:hypothetical protein ACQB60_15890 [Actinomycetota bacterium Odt1-20B]
MQTMLTAEFWAMFFTLLFVAMGILFLFALATQALYDLTHHRPIRP